MSDRSSEQLALFEPDQAPTLRRHAAIHEAGHALTARLLGVPVIGVSIDDAGAGSTELDTRRAPPWKLGVVAAAGPMAVRHNVGRTNTGADEYSVSDEAMSRQAIDRLRAQDWPAGEDDEWEYLWVEFWLGAFWNQPNQRDLLRLADHLERAGSVTGRELRVYARP